MRSDVADAVHCHVLAGRDASRNADEDLLFSPDPAFASTLLARRGYHRSLAGAARARRDANYLAKERALRATHFPGSPASTACDRRRPRLGAPSVAPVARLEQTHCDCLIGA